MDMSQKKILERMQKEIDRMIKTCPKIATKGIRFMKNQDQIDYDTLERAYNLVEAMTPKEYYEVTERILRREKEQDVTLF